MYNSSSSSWNFALSIYNDSPQIILCFKFWFAYLHHAFILQNSGSLEGSVIAIKICACVYKIFLFYLAMSPFLLSQTFRKIGTILFLPLFFGSCFFGMASFHSFHALLAWFISGSCFFNMTSFNFFHALLTWFISIYPNLPSCQDFWKKDS